jgi:hypothetical protein
MSNAHAQTHTRVYTHSLECACASGHGSAKQTVEARASPLPAHTFSHGRVPHHTYLLLQQRLVLGKAQARVLRLYARQVRFFEHSVRLPSNANHGARRPRHNPLHTSHRSRKRIGGTPVHVSPPPLPHKRTYTHTQTIPARHKRRGGIVPSACAAPGAAPLARPSCRAPQRAHPARHPPTELHG